MLFFLNLGFFLICVIAFFWYIFSNSFNTQFHKFYINYQIINMIVFLAYNLIMLFYVIFESNDILNRVWNIIFSAVIFCFLSFVLAYSFRLKEVIYDHFNDHHVDVKTVDLDKPLESNVDFYAEKITKFDEEEGVEAVEKNIVETLKIEEVENSEKNDFVKVT